MTAPRACARLVEYGARLILRELWARELCHQILEQIAPLHELEREYDVRQGFELLDEANNVSVLERAQALDFGRRALGRAHVEDLHLWEELEGHLLVRNLVLADAHFAEASLPEQDSHAVPPDGVRQMRAVLAVGLAAVRSPVVVPPAVLLLGES